MAEKPDEKPTETAAPKAASKPKCPEGHEVEVYDGGDANPHKVGTMFCATCGKRYPVEGA